MSEFDLARTRKTLFGALLDARATFGRNKVALEDLERQPVTFGRLVLGALVLGRKLASLTQARETVGVLLPNVPRHSIHPRRPEPTWDTSSA